MANILKESVEIQPRLLDIRQTAKYLSIAPQSIYNGRTKDAKNPFPVKAKRFGRRLLWDVRDLDAFIEQM